MSWAYCISTHHISWNGSFVGLAYSGHGEGRNNVAMADVPNIGPTPPGAYTIGPPYDDAHLGPCVMHLDPQEGTETFGRSLFRIHGNNAQNDASHGCIIADRAMRVQISKSGDTTMVVTP